MSVFDTPSDRYNVVARLFNLISELLPDKQFILYKQLIKDNLQNELFKLILDLKDEEKAQLLELLSEAPYDQQPVTSVNLDENESLMRKHPRKICLIPVKCTIEDRSFKSYIIDISTMGLFIETNDRFALGQEVQMAFKLPGYAEALVVKGRIGRSGTRGVGVNFVDLTPGQEALIRTFIEKRQ